MLLILHFPTHAKARILILVSIYNYKENLKEGKCELLLNNFFHSCS